MNAFLDISGTLDIFSELKKQSQRWIGYHLDQEIQSWIEEMEGEEWWTVLVVSPQVIGVPVDQNF